MIEQQLIEKALALTGKTMEDMLQIDFDYGYVIKNQQIVIGYNDANIELCFSIEKFGWYLLSLEFIEKFAPIFIYKPITAQLIGEAIYEYQKGNEQPLISLLEKIG